jgi:hypothetical protein
LCECITRFRDSAYWVLLSRTQITSIVAESPSF